MLAGLVSGTYLTNSWQGIRVNVDFYTAKGIVGNLLQYFGLKGRYHFEVEETMSDMHPGRTANIIVDRTKVGYLGQVHPKRNKQEIYVFEIDLEALMTIKTRGIKFKELNKYPTVKKDVAFIVKQTVTSEEIKKVIMKAGGRLLTNVSVFDVYVGENVQPDEKSIAYSLEFQDMTRTLNDEEVTQVFNHIIEKVETTLDAKLRDK